MRGPHPLTNSIPRRTLAALLTAALSAPLLIAQGAPAPGGTLDRIRAAGRIRLGYRIDARPFAYQDAGKPTGYSIGLCQTIVEALKGEGGLSGVSADWVPVNVDDRFTALQQGRIDLLCGADTITLARREQASFSLPIFPGGIGVVVRADAPVRLRDVLAGRGQSYRPVWRGAASEAVQSRGFAVVRGTTADAWLGGRIRDLQVITSVSRVHGYDEGVSAVLARTSDAFFAERAVLLDAAKRHPSARDLLVIDRAFTFEPLALGLPRNDEAFRLIVDRALSRVYASSGFAGTYAAWFGEPDETALTFFRWNTLPE